MAGGCTTSLMPSDATQQPVLFSWHWSLAYMSFGLQRIWTVVSAEPHYILLHPRWRTTGLAKRVDLSIAPSRPHSTDCFEAWPSALRMEQQRIRKCFSMKPLSQSVVGRIWYGTTLRQQQTIQHLLRRCGCFTSCTGPTGPSRSTSNSLATSAPLTEVQSWSLSPVAGVKINTKSTHRYASVKKMMIVEFWSWPNVRTGLFL